MEDGSNVLISLLSKPAVGLTGGVTSICSNLLTWHHIIPLFFSHIGAVLGGIVAAIHLYLLIRRKFWSKEFLENYHNPKKNKNKNNDVDEQIDI